MSDNYKSPFFDDENISSGASQNNDLNSTTDNLDLNSFVRARVQKDEPKTLVDKAKFIALDAYSKVRKKINKNKKVKKTLGQKILTSLLVFGIAFALVIMSFVIYVFGFVDDEVQENLHDLKLNFTTTLYVKNAKTGKWKEYQRLHGNENRIWVSFDKMPDHLKDAFVSIEDQRFYDHNGVDWKRTFGAFINMFVDVYSSNQGGSTITQQLVKNLTGDNDQNAMRKIREIMRARYLENNYDKDVILECYLNTASFANGICGVEVASNYYFNKNVEDLTIAESAALAAIVKYPEKYRPDKFPEDNKERRKLVLDKMLELEKISQKQYDKAIDAKVKIVADTSKLMEKEINNYFVDALIDDVVDDLVKKYDFDRSHAEVNFYNGGYKIYCTIDPSIQKDIEEVCKNPIYSSTSASGQKAQAAITVMDYEGHVLGMCGGLGKKTANRSLNRATDSLRPPGSTMKPMGAYAPALENNIITYSSFLKDQPITTAQGKKWPPNWYGYYGGNTPVFKAIERSINTIPAQLVEKVGMETSFDFLVNNLGITTLERDESKDLTYSNLALGGSFKGITTTEQAAAYATFGNLGYYYKPALYTVVKDQHGEVILENEGKPTVAMSEDTAYIMNKLLLHPVYGSQATGGAARSYLPSHQIFAKTGTTDAQNDLWFVGGTAHYVASCWYGFDQPETIPNSGAALRVWGAVMQKIHEGLEKKDFPESSYVTIRRYCKKTGLVANSGCPIGGAGYYKESYLPACDKHKGSLLDGVSSVYNLYNSKTSSKRKTSSKKSSSTTAPSSSQAPSSTAPSSTSTVATSSALPPSSVTEENN